MTNISPQSSSRNFLQKNRGGSCDVSSSSSPKNWRTWKTLRIDVLLNAVQACGLVCVCGGTPPATLDDSLKAMHGCFMHFFSLCARTPRFRFTTGRGWFGDFFFGGDRGTADCNEISELKESLGRKKYFRVARVKNNLMTGFKIKLSCRQLLERAACSSKSIFPFSRGHLTCL